jgi:hypothetical protein
MATICDEAISNFNRFLKDQKEFPGTANFTLVLFDDEYLVVHDGRNINDVPDLDETIYIPRGWTALLDAVGNTIIRVGERLSNTPEDERPEKVIFAILTDGAENFSKEYNHTKVMKMINHQRDTYSWDFIFLAANQDAIQVGASLGIKSNDSYNFTANSVGTQDAFKNMTRSVSSYRVS